MNKHLAAVKAIFDKKKTSVKAKLAQASLTAEQKTKLDETMAQIDSAIAELEAADTEATFEQITAVFSKAVETLSAISEQTVEQVQTDVQAMIAKLQAQISVSEKAKKKFSAKMSFKTMKAAAKGDEGWKHYSAGVDVTAWTPEAEVEDVEIFHQLIGVASGLNVSPISTTMVKIRKFEMGEGTAAVVDNHGVKPTISMVAAETGKSVETYAGVVEGVADEDLEDNSGLQTEIQQAALDNLSSVENLAAITLLKGVASSFSNAKFGTKSYADEKTAISAIIDQVRQALGIRQSEICFALNSSEWARLKDLRNANGTPIDIQSVVGDVIQITDNSLTAGEFICWAKKFARLRIYKGQTTEWYKGIKSTVVDGKVTAVYSEWRTDESSLRVRQRQLMYVTDSTTVVKGTIPAVVEAVTAEPVVG